MTEKKFPESASIEFIDQYGNHVLVFWHPTEYYYFEHKILGEKRTDVPLPDSRARGPKEMPRTFKWVLDQVKKAKEVISSTVPEIEVTKKRGKHKRAKRKKR